MHYLYLICITVLIYVIIFKTHNRLSIELFSTQKNKKSYGLVNLENEQIVTIPDFPDIYVINLKINKMRLRILEKYFRRENLKFTRFPAYHGKKLDEKYLIQNGILSHRHSLRNGQLGCALSHLTLLEMIKQKKKDMALILEDDVIIPYNFAYRLKKILLNLPSRWDIIFLGGCNIYGKKVNKYFIQPTKYNQTYNLCMHAYLVNYRNIDRIIKYIKPFRRPVDSQLREAFHLLNIYYVNPNLIIQNKNIRSTRRDLDGFTQSKYWYDNQTNITVL